MMSEIYTFNNKDITLTMCIVIREVIHEIQKELNLEFMDAFKLFYLSKTYRTMTNTENGLWAESPQYICDRFLEERA